MTPNSEDYGLFIACQEIQREQDAAQEVEVAQAIGLYGTLTVAVGAIIEKANPSEAVGDLFIWFGAVGIATGVGLAIKASVQSVLTK